MLSVDSNSYTFSAECSALFGHANMLLFACLHFSVLYYFFIPAWELFGGTTLQLCMLTVLLLRFVLDQL
jgi:hypothetical protein